MSGAATGAHGVPPNVSVVVGGTRDAVRDRHHLYVQGRHVGSPTTDGRLLRSIVRAGAALATGPAPGTVAVNAVAVVTPNASVVLVEAGLHHELQRVRSRLERDGCRILDGATVTVDPAAGRCVVPDAAAVWRIDRRRFDSAFPPRRGDDDLGPLDAFVTRVIAPTSTIPANEAEAVAAVAGLVRDRTGRLHPADVEGLAQLLARAELVPYRLTDPVPLPQLLA